MTPGAARRRKMAGPGAAARALAGLVLLAGCAPVAPAHPPQAFQTSQAPQATQPAATAETVLVPAAVRAPPRRGTPLDRFFDDLRRLESGKAERVRILQIGDSHTAGDVLSARLRSQFQARFGDAGRGMMPAGIPYEGLRHREVTIAQTGRWAYDNSLRQADGGPYGLTGFVARSRSAGARLVLASNDGDGFDTASIDYLRLPRAGRLVVRAGGRTLREVATASRHAGLGTLEVPIPRGTREIEVVAPDKRGVALLGWTVERKRRGIVYDSLGVSGAQVGIVSRWSPEIVKRELQARRPSLVIVAYGTNEGFTPALDQERYAQQFAAQVLAIQSAVPTAAVLIVGPPDGQRVDPACAARRTVADCRWTTPEGLEVVRATQRAFAQRAGVAFWDWSTVMGRGGIDAWTRIDPPLARADHVHMTRAGYELTADTLFAKLMRDYAAHKAGGPRRAATDGTLETADGPPG